VFGIDDGKMNIKQSAFSRHIAVCLI